MCIRDRYDAGAREVGFEQPDFDDSYWENAKYREFADYTLYEQNTSMLVFEEIRPVLTERTAQGYFIDFGSNYVRYPVFTARGEKKTAVTVHLSLIHIFFIVTKPKAESST